MPNEESFDDLLKRLDGVERRKPALGREDVAPYAMTLPDPSGDLVNFEHVKRAVEQWIAEHRGK